jgi:dolichol-phosphate mannosyltransferase
MNKLDQTLISVVAVLKNSAGTVEQFCERLTGVLRQHFEYYEIILVDDRSSDSTVAAVMSMQQVHNNIQLLCLQNSSGEGAALTAGLDRAIGDMVITLDPYTDDPALIPRMVEQATAESAPIVYAVPVSGSETWFYRHLTGAFIRFLARINRIDLPRGISTYRLLTRAVLNELLNYPDRHRLLPVAAALGGYKYATVPATMLPGFRRSVHLRSLGKAFGVLFSASVQPLRIVTISALVTSALLIMYSLYVILAAVLQDEVASGWASISLAISTMFFVLFLSLAVMSEYLLRVRESTSGQKFYTIGRKTESAVLDYSHHLNITENKDGKATSVRVTRPTQVSEL